ncbi:NADP-dependent oxidoreductase domain-containing protein [Mycena epipterygia]|nr:NADP-dependent oxidoreductase domain-containing protein [Mycena epipterygia]
MSVPTRKIGGVSVSAIGLGVISLAGAYGAIGDEEERLKFLDEAYAAGCTMWDTADMYGDLEELIGKWFKRTGKRDEIFLATKFGFITKDGKSGVDGSPEYARLSLDKSLKKLDVDCIDLYYTHRPDTTVPIEYTVAAMAEFVKAGKVKHLGLCEVSGATLSRAHAVHPIAAVQVEYSPFTLEIEDPKVGLLAACRDLGVAVVAYSPLGCGLLPGTIRSHDDLPEKDFRRIVPRYAPENFPNILKIVDGLAAIGAKYNNASSSQITLAWLLAQGSEIIPIPGTKQIKYLKENLAAASLALSDKDVAAIRQLVNDAHISADRYPAPYVSSMFSFVETPEIQ